jgi:hypothetical protein
MIAWIRRVLGIDGRRESVVNDTTSPTACDETINVNVEYVQQDVHEGVQQDVYEGVQQEDDDDTEIAESFATELAHVCQRRNIIQRLEAHTIHSVGTGTEHDHELQLKRQQHWYMVGQGRGCESSTSLNLFQSQQPRHFDQ